MGTCRVLRSMETVTELQGVKSMLTGARLAMVGQKILLHIHQGTSYE